MAAGSSLALAIASSLTGLLWPITVTIALVVFASVSVLWRTFDSWRRGRLSITQRAALDTPLHDAAKLAARWRELEASFDAFVTVQAVQADMTRVPYGA